MRVLVFFLWTCTSNFKWEEKNDSNKNNKRWRLYYYIKGGGISIALNCIKLLIFNFTHVIFFFYKKYF